ncbi:wsv174 [White spot syndrome virus]|uniref:Wsv174 n=4 Tax=White spot syndrome virus TaxID=342409 RepID=Q8VB26_WSSVS|nr:wsv174 [Shrimp white spot syndrome virus]AFX59552.1 wsv174 [White spot syndrome virus]AAL33178.1 wsv174 [Shrimp white spot syndrome virus]AAL89098.1 WSSV230 [Shrimp white spot syndrome virus]AWQ60352.1 wsv174 [Shrimp white spot syndrome virus]AWQ60765.1 wsv174 [Shrimp white spot syndrome virus]
MISCRGTILPMLPPHCLIVEQSHPNFPRASFWAFKMIALRVFMILLRRRQSSPRLLEDSASTFMI